MLLLLLLCGALGASAGSAPAHTCGGALQNRVAAGGPASAAGWSHTREDTAASVGWDAELAHNGSSGSLQIAGGHGTWTTNLTGLAGKTIRLGFWRHTVSDATTPFVVAEVFGVESTDRHRVTITRDVSAMPAGWQEMFLGDFAVPANGTGAVTLALSLEGPRCSAERRADGQCSATLLNATTVNMATFSCSVVPPASAQVDSPLTLIAGGSGGCTAHHGHASARILPSKLPSIAASADVEPSGVSLFGAQNERLMFQVLLTGGCASTASAASFHWPDFKPTSRGAEDRARQITAGNMSVREVVDMQLTIPQLPHGQLGSVPEYLADAAPSGSGNASATFWFKLVVPAAAEAGNVSTTVSGPGGLSFTVNLEVAPPALAIPENPSLDVYGNVWQYAGKTPAKLPQFEAFYQNLWEHRVFTGPDMNEPHAQIWPVSSTLRFFRLLLLLFQSS